MFFIILFIYFIAIKTWNGGFVIAEFFLIYRDLMLEQTGRTIFQIV